ncbi:MAG: hypothetical protein ACW98U_16325 [Candidatus Thorarchaeota archaeon]
MTRLGKVGRDSEEEISERMPSELSDSLVCIKWLMMKYEISSEVLSELIEEKVQVMRESLDGRIRFDFYSVILLKDSQLVNPAEAI